MKKSTIFSIAVLLGGGIAMTSCSDYLDPNNKSQGTDADAYFNTDEGLASARSQAYYSLKAAALSDKLNCDGTDLYIPVRGKTPSEYERYAVVSNDKDAQNYYNACYGEVRYGMFYAERAAARKDSTSTAITLGEAEGRFIRDYAYYQLTQQFGGVPYVDHFVNEPERVFPKAKCDSIYTIMEQDLEQLYNNSPLPASDHKNGYISKQAVASLLAKFYLAHAWDYDTQLNNAERGTYTVNSTANFQKAAQWAKTAINGQQFTQTFEQKWAPSNEGNDEQIWSIQYERKGWPGSDNGGHGLQNLYGNYYGEPKAVGQKNVGSTEQASAKAIYLWQPGDDRYDGTFMTKMYNYKDGEWGTTGYFAYYNAKQSDLDQMPYAYRYFPYYYTEAQVRAEIAAHPEHYQQNGYHNTVEVYILASPIIRYVLKADGTIGSRTTIPYNHSMNIVGSGATVKKFDDAATEQVDGKTDIDYRDIVVFDMSDMYLTVAEADLMAGNTDEALQYVNAVRDRSNAGHLSSFAAYEPAYAVPSSFGDVTPLDVILDERARELFGQQVRWIDLRRTKQLVRYNIAFNEFINSAADMTGPDGNIKWLRPIPQAAIDGNNSMTEADQNPGY